MIIDTTDCMIVRESELGQYDTARVSVVYACNGFVRLATGEEFKLQPKEKLIERVRK